MFPPRIARPLRAALCVCAVMLVAAGFAPSALAASTVVTVAEASQGTLSGWNVSAISDPSATNGSAVRYGSNGSASLQVKLPSDADTITLRLRGDQCSGSPAFTLSVDGATAANGTVPSASWTTVAVSRFLGAGTHVLNVAFTNSYVSVWPSCARRLYLDTETFSTSAGFVAPGNPPIPAGFVHQSGTGLLDGAGNPIRLRGVDLGGWLSWEGWIWGQSFDYIGESAMMNNLANLVGQTQADQFRSAVYANFVTSSDFRAMSEDGFNVARLPFNYRLLEDDTNPFVYKQSGWAVLDQAVAEAKANNVYLVLDMHVAPCSQMLAFVSDYVGGPFLWTSQQCQDRMVAMWQAIASRYASENVIAGYDLLGETIISDPQLLALYERVTAAIRQVDPHHLIIYEGNDMARTFTMFTGPIDSNEMLSFHDYPWMIPGQDLSARMPLYDAAARLVNAPQWAGEFGQSTYSDIQTYVTTFNQDPLMAGWTDWTWKESPGFPEMQTLQLTPAAQMLIGWMNNPSRPKPTLAQAQQGMSDFITDIAFDNTLPDARMQQILGGAAGGAVFAAQTVSGVPTAQVTGTGGTRTPTGKGGVRTATTTGRRHAHTRRAHRSKPPLHRHRSHRRRHQRRRARR